MSNIVHGVGAYIRRLSTKKHGTPEQAAKRAADHGLSHVLIMGVWQQPRKNRNNRVIAGAPNKKKLAAYADAFHEKGIKVGLWYYPWAGYEEHVIDLLGEQCALTQIDMLSNDAELGYKWKKKLSARQIERQFGTSMRGIQPEAIRDVVAVNTDVYVKACAKKLVKGIDYLVEEHQMIWGPWQTSYGIAQYHPNFPWEIFTGGAEVLSPQLYSSTPAQVDMGIRNWYEKANDLDHFRPMMPSIPTYGPNSGDKLHAHLSNFVDGDEDVDGFTAWSWMQTNSKEWDVLARWADWLERDMCRMGGRQTV